MGRINNRWIAGLFLSATFLLSSCLDDNEPDYSQLTIGTVKLIEGNDYYFKLDPGNKMYPGDTTHIENYALNDGQRAFVYFDLLDEKVPGYDYNAVIYRIENILTKDIVGMPSEESEEKIGNDRINVSNAWIANGYINIQYQLLHNNTADQKHYLNLVVNENLPNSEGNDSYLTLEFRHNGFKNEGNTLASGLVSFRLDKINENISGKKGLNICYRSLYEGVLSKTIDFK